MIEQLNQSDVKDAWLLAKELGYLVDEEVFYENLAEIGKQQSILLAAKIDGKVCGFLVARLNVGIVEGVYGEIVALVVSKNYRRIGLGRELVKAAEKWLSLHSNVVRVRSNVKRIEAHEFYIALGFNHSKTQALYAKSV